MAVDAWRLITLTLLFQQISKQLMHGDNNNRCKMGSWLWYELTFISQQNDGGVTSLQY